MEYEAWQLLLALLPTLGTMKVYRKHEAGTQRVTETGGGPDRLSVPGSVVTEVWLKPCHSCG